MVYNKHLVIVGTARSGTSWLSETIAKQYRYRMIFEPEHEFQTQQGHLLCDQWITLKEEHQQADVYLKRIFANRVDCDWIAQNSNRRFKRHLWPFVPKKYIIKFVRGNLLASYIDKCFGIPVVHMLRNPYDVIFSQKQVNFPWLLDLDRFVSQPKLVQQIKSHFGYDISQYRSLSDIEILCLRWCIENVLPLEVFDVNVTAVDVVRYEALFSDIEVFFDLCKRHHLTPVDEIEAVYKLPSTKTHPSKHTLHNKENKIYKWGSNELKQINNILDVFETQLYNRI
ncbi:sulfotransferase family protein [Aestuariibaculum sp. M13]|uniref:sulfotransferase family protein n=1 Tax=Aestuariibaculum sp. M13 TaxID=2967132 RepID=UPI00215A0ACD|nr:sulfotransferase family protein [Aestuariibaculum sp. M13]MCR8666356.1 sulfotransferase family protein [Aestuariibaculum sp. M13]